MKLEIRNIKEVETLAKARVNLAEGNRPLYYGVPAAIAVLAAYFLQAYNQFLAVVVGAGGVVIYFWYRNIFDKKVKVVMHGLMKEWNQEVKNG